MENQMTAQQFFGIILQAINFNYGERFEELTKDEKAAACLMFAKTLTDTDKDLMNTLALAVYNAITESEANT